MQTLAYPVEYLFTMLLQKHCSTTGKYRFTKFFGEGTLATLQTLRLVFAEEPTSQETNILLDRSISKQMTGRLRLADDFTPKR
ncbi:hypothetical protein TNCT_181381 [Trichonephila clavata]|uniref:Uncharacterized protein n=1 Tax=Trichonephila clavata TaxID=2740835 RepID=A0A8X6I258_TRICU|nr:hypothetical protein TNCT_181381 [Trichonephila clavata]